MLGQSHLSIRLGELVQKLGLEAVIAPLESPNAALQRSWQGLPVVEGEEDDPGLWERLPLEGARAALLCAASDSVNLALALRIRDAYPDLRLVISFYNLRLGRKLELELGNCAVLSSAEISAPCFAAAALKRGVLRAIVHDERVYALVAGQDEITERGQKIAAELTFLPSEEMLGSDPLLQQAHRAAAHFLHPKWAADRYVVGILGSIVCLLLGATAYFHFDQGMPWLSALYFVVTTFCTVGYGDYSLREASDLTKAAGILLMLASVTLTAGLFAILTNALVQKRADVLEGRRRYRMRDHIIVCGLGLTGLRVTECLHAMGLKVLVIERNGENPLLQELAAQNIPYMISDATRERTLLHANVHSARALVCVVNQDLIELEIGLAARAVRPDIHLVLRIFEGSFADRIEKHFRIHTALSASSLAATVFLAKALDFKALDLLKFEDSWSALVAGPPDQPGRCLVSGERSLYLRPLNLEH